MLFFQKNAKNQPKFLLHFYIDIDVLMLCSKFKADSDFNFSIYDHFLKTPNFVKKSLYYSPRFFPKNG